MKSADKVIVPIVILIVLQGYETTCFETLTIPPPVELTLATATTEEETNEEENDGEWRRTNKFNVDPALNTCR